MKIKTGCKAATGDFWYDLSIGGYLKPEEILSNEGDMLAVKNAIEIIKDFERSCEDQIEDFYV